MTPPPNVIYLADHPVVLALPAVIPAFVIALAVIVVVVRDRRAERAENELKDANEREDTA
ncbi:hypothetical protein [Rhodococcus sp. 077-4]|uniref:hypothetical protein n=1 Tax=Rhodococcus sp. 077-4 TaxID=2789271 RepID=UPI0039F50224